MLQAASPLLLPALLHKRALTCGLLHHLASDPPGVILGVLQLLQDRALTGRVPAATQFELWSDGALEQLALVAAAKPAASVEQKAADAGEAAAADGSGGTAEARGSGSSSDEDSSSSSSDISDSEADADDAMPGRAPGMSSGDAATLEQQQLEAAAAQRVQQAAATAYDILLLLLTNAAHGLVSATAARQQQVAAVPSVGERRALRLLQRLQPGHSSSHARLLQAVADAQPQLAAELLQGLSYQLEPKPCGAWLGSAAAVICLVAAAARAPLQLKQRVARTLAALDGRGSSSLSAAAALLPPDSEAPAVRAAVRTCLPSALPKVRRCGARCLVALCISLSHHARLVCSRACCCRVCCHVACSTHPRLCCPPPSA
jgi:hypothetical protein